MEHLLAYGFLAPPTVFISLALLGAIIAAAGWRSGGIALALVSSLCLYIAAMPAFSAWLIEYIEAQVPRRVDLHPAQAIVVLGGDERRGDDPGDPEELGPLSQERVELAADAYRQLHLPVAVSGGAIKDAHTSLAALMKQALEHEFSVPVTWTEDRSTSTWENAAFTAQILRPAGIRTVVVVTHAWHLPRAIWAFEHAGLTALPWPAPRQSVPKFDEADDFLPNPMGLAWSYLALHEFVGGIYYRLLY
jgi:uncharacterized SAM-binding protein YcdF (DUF218 family)